jgi:hypothetical protein
MKKDKTNKILIALSILCFSFTSITNNPIDNIGVKGPLEFNKTNFKLFWANKTNDNYYVQEYLPDGEKLENFNQMLTIHLFNTDIKTEAAVGQKIKELTLRKKTDSTCNYQVTESPDGKEFIVDFLIGEKKENKIAILEFNIYHYKQIDISENKKAIIVYAYSKRNYGDDVDDFFKRLKNDRINYLNQMISTNIPKVTLENK